MSLSWSHQLFNDRTILLWTLLLVHIHVWKPKNIYMCIYMYMLRFMFTLSLLLDSLVSISCAWHSFLFDWCIKWTENFIRWFFPFHSKSTKESTYTKSRQRRRWRRRWKKHNHTICVCVCVYGSNQRFFLFDCFECVCDGGYWVV